MRRLFLGLLFPLALAAQTPVAIVNPSFEQGAPLNTWNYVLPGWTITGQAGEWQPAVSSFSSVPNGATVAYSNGGSISEDLGAGAQAGTYIVTILAGSRLDGPQSTAISTITLLAGVTSLCTQSIPNASIPRGTFHSLGCTAVVNTAPTGNLTISLGCSGVQCDFDSATLTFTPLVAPVQNPVNVSISATYDDGSVPTILSVSVVDVTVPNSTVTDLSLTPDPVTGAASGSFTLSSSATYEVILTVAGAQVGQTFYQGNPVLALMPQISQANFGVVLFKANGAVKSFTSSAQ